MEKKIKREELIERVEEAMYNFEEEFDCEVCGAEPEEEVEDVDLPTPFYLCELGELTEEDKTYIEDNYPIEINVACDGSRYYVIGDLRAHFGNLKADYIFWHGLEQAA